MLSWKKHWAPKLMAYAIIFTSAKSIQYLLHPELGWEGGPNLEYCQAYNWKKERHNDTMQRL